MKHASTAVLALGLGLALAAGPALAEVDYGKLRKDERVHRELLAASLAYLIDGECDELTVRRLYVATAYALPLRSYAKGLGYSGAEVDDYVNSKVEQDRFRAIAEAWLAKQGASKGDKAGYCKVGRAEMEKETLLGSFLKEG